MSVLLFTYAFSNMTTEPPTGNQLRFDSDISSGTRKIWVRYLTVDGTDAFFALMSTAVNFTVWVQDKDDHTKVATFIQTGDPIDKGGYVELPVEWDHDGAPLSNQQVLLGLVSPAEEGPVTHTVPTVIGLTEAAATAALLDANLLVGTVTSAPHATLAAGLVSLTLPAAGTLVSPGTEVALRLSTGPSAMTGPLPPPPGSLQGPVPPASSPQVFVGAVITLRIQVQQANGTALDVSTASPMTMELRKPTGVVLLVPATPTTDGTDGQVEYLTVDGDLDVAGPWFGQVLLTMVGVPVRSSSFALDVAELVTAPTATTPAPLPTVAVAVTSAVAVDDVFDV